MVYTRFRDAVGRWHGLKGRYVRAPTRKYFNPKSGRWHTGKRGNFTRAPVPRGPRDMWRLTIGINYYVIHSQYHSFIIQWWFKHKPTDDKINECKETFIKDFSKIMGYSKIDWWYVDEEDINVELERVPYDINLVDKSESREQDVGKTSTTGDAHRVRFARRMIKSGKWHTQATLDRWRWAL